MRKIITLIFATITMTSCSILPTTPLGTGIMAGASAAALGADTTTVVGVGLIASYGSADFYEYQANQDRILSKTHIDRSREKENTMILNQMWHRKVHMNDISDMPESVYVESTEYMEINGVEYVPQLQSTRD